MKSEETSIQIFAAHLGLFAALFALSGCGAQSFSSSQKTAEAKSMVFQSTDGVTTPDSSSSTAGSTTTTTTVTGVPPYKYLISGVGYNAKTVQVRAGQVLKVKFTAGLPSQKVDGTGFTATYSQLGVFIKVGDYEEATELLSNGLYSGQFETSHVIDLAGAIPDRCATNDRSCRKDVTITVYKPNYDFYCLIGYACPYTHVWETHPWNGTLTVQTDDTDGI